MFRGKETPVTEIARELGLPYHRVYSRVTRRETGDDIEASPEKRKPHWNTVELDGKKMTLKEAVEGSGLTCATVSRRMVRGFTIEDALAYQKGHFDINGEKMTLRQATEKYGRACWNTTRTRMYHLGWSLEEALATPPGQKRLSAYDAACVLSSCLDAASDDS